jgi:hypothetical protein
MTSNLGTRRLSDRPQDLARAYDGEVPVPFYWQAATAPLRKPSRPHPGEIGTVLPYAMLPDEMLLATAVSLDQVDEMLERRARREEVAGG